MGEDNVSVFRFAASLGSTNEGCRVANLGHVALKKSSLHTLTKAMEEGLPHELTSTARVVHDSRLATRLGGPFQQRPHLRCEEEVPEVVGLDLASEPVRGLNVR